MSTPRSVSPGHPASGPIPAGAQPFGRKGLLRRCVLLLCLFGCLATGSLVGQDAAGHRVWYVGMILGSGGLGDRSFNDSAYEGLRDAQNRHGIRFEVAEFSSKQSSLGSLRDFAEQGYDLVIGIGFENQEPIEVVAREYPDVRFALIDAQAGGPNVASVIYREHEGDFLMGVLAAMLTQTRKVGFIGGVDISVIRRIEGGFRQGVAFQDAEVQVVSDMAGTFSDAEIGRRLALSQYASGVDIIYNAAGRTGLGIIQAAKQAGKLTIGTSGDQRYLAPDHVVGNRPKRVDSAVLKLVEEIKSGGFVPGLRSFGLREGGLSLGPFNEQLVTRTMVRHLEQLQSRIVNGEIRVKEVE